MTQQQTKDKKKDRAKIRCGIIYEENIPQGIEKVVDEITEITDMYRNLSILISPLHKPDEEAKKPHYHLLFMSSTELTVDTFDNILNQFKGTKSMKVFSKRKYLRYLLHLDNPEKQQFQGGASDLYYINCNRSEIEQEIQIEDEYIYVAMVLEYLSIEGNKSNFIELINYIKKTEDIITYRKFMKYASRHAYFISQLIR